MVSTKQTEQTSLQNNFFSDTLKKLPETFKEDVDNVISFFASNDGNFRITNAGPMNPGKSTLFNALLKKKEVFKTADARQTAVAQEEQWKKQVMLVDTPGCNSAVFEDNDESVAAFRKADFITFVHNINTGGLIDAELKILSHIKTIFGETDFISRVCIVCNRIDDVSDDETLERNKKEIHIQIKENLGCELKMYCVSPLNYLRGLELDKCGQKEEADIFITYSNMKELLAAVSKAIKSGKRGASKIKEFIEKLNSACSAHKENINAQNMQIKNARSDANACWKTVLENILPSWEECSELNSNIY